MKIKNTASRGMADFVILVIILLVLLLLLIFLQKNSFGLGPDKEVQEFKGICEKNCHQPLAYIYKDGNRGEEPDLVAYVFYNHRKEMNGSHCAEDIYGIVIYSRLGPAWGTNLRVIIKGQDRDTGNYILDDFLKRVSRMEPRGELKEYEKSILNIVKNLFDKEIGDREAVKLFKGILEQKGD